MSGVKQNKTDRQAAALRENLRKRRDQSRARAASADGAAGAIGPAGGADGNEKPEGERAGDQPLWHEANGAAQLSPRPD